MAQGTLSYKMERLGMDFTNLFIICLIINSRSNKIILYDVLAWQKCRRSHQDASTAGANQGCRQPTRFERGIAQQ